MADVNVSVGADTGGFSAGMASIRNEVGRVTTGVSSSLASLINPASLVTAALTTGVFAIIEYADRIYDTAQRFRIGTTELQQFGQAAEKNGASLESVAKAFNKLDVSLSQARHGNVEMRKSLENLKILDWADQSQTLSQNMLKIGTSSMDASDMVKVLGKSGTELRETLAGLANGSEKLASAIDEKTVKALSDMSDAFKEAKNQLVVLGATGVGWLKSFDDWLKRIEISAREAGQEMKSVFTFGSGGPPGIPGGGAGAGGLGGGIPGNRAPAPGTPSADDISRTEKFFDLQEQIEATLSKEQQVWVLLHSQMDQVIELQNQRVNLENQLSETIATEGADSQRAFELREEIAEVTAKIIPLEEKISSEKAKQAQLDADGAAKADQALQESQQRLEIQALINSGHEDEAKLLQITIDFNKQITEAINRANEARQDGLEATAQENDLLVQQLEIEKQNSLEIERQNQAIRQQQEEQKRNLAIANQIRDAAAALLFYNLRIGEAQHFPSFFNDPKTGFTGELTGPALDTFNRIRDLMISLSNPNVGPGQQQSILNQIHALEDVFLSQLKILESINKNLTPTPGGN